MRTLRKIRDGYVNALDATDRWVARMSYQGRHWAAA